MSEEVLATSSYATPPTYYMLLPPLIYMKVEKVNVKLPFQRIILRNGSGIQLEAPYIDVADVTNRRGALWLFCGFQAAHS